MELLGEQEDVRVKVAGTKDIEAELEKPVVEDVEAVEQMKPVRSGEEKKEEESTAAQDEKIET